MRLEYGAATHAGLQRCENQDRYLASGAIFAVADGLGGHSEGGTAAAIAAETLSREGRVGSLADLIALVGSANAAIFEAARDDPSLCEMSTTVCALADASSPANPSRLVACNVGDSRLYALTPDGFSRITVDHTISENLVRDGVISAGEAAGHADRHTLTRAVGYEPRVHVDGWELSPVSGTRFLLCSDGLTGEIAAPDIAEILRSDRSAAAAASSLVGQAIRPGHGRDNVTAVVVDVMDGPESRPDGLDRMVLDFRPAVPA